MKIVCRSSEFPPSFPPTPLSHLLYPSFGSVCTCSAVLCLLLWPGNATCTSCRRLDGWTRLKQMTDTCAFGEAGKVAIDFTVKSRSGEWHRTVFSRPRQKIMSCLRLVQTKLHHIMLVLSFFFFYLVRLFALLHNEELMPRSSKQSDRTKTS